MNEPLEYVIQKIRSEFENRLRYHGKDFHASFTISIDIQDGEPVYGMINGMKYKIPRELLDMDRRKGKT